MTCQRKDCTFASTGICVNGHLPPSACPELAQHDVGDDDASRETERRQVVFPEGEALRCIEAETITRAFLTDVIIFAGAAESGKTTLLTSLYEAFQDAPFGGYRFAGSETLPGFERRCHEGRVISGTFEPDTARTNPLDGLRFLHLAVRQQNGRGPQRHLLMSDISGELFRQVVNATEEVRRLTILHRADRLVLLLDGAKLAEPSARQVALNDARSILRSIVEARMLHRSCEVDVVFSKWDVISSTLPEITLPFVTEVEKQLTSGFESKVRALRFFPVAARPTSPSLPFAHGIAQLLSVWLNSMPSAGRPNFLTTLPGDGTEYDQYATRFFRRQHLDEFYDIDRI